MRRGLRGTARRWGGTSARALGALAWSVLRAPRPRQEVPVVGTGPAPLVPRGRAISVLVWNVQFAAGRGFRFFYDGGPDVVVPTPTVIRTLDGLADVIRSADPDVVVLQEVDRGSDRTGRIDQHAELLARVPYPCHVSTPYFRNRYVPYPPHRHLGRVDMHLSVFSRFRIARAIRWQLPPLAESWIRRQFNLRRALLEAELPLDDGGRMRIFDVHLSAFSRGDGTLARQVAHVAARLEDSDRDGVPWLLAGDFNALPPGDDPARLPDPDLYSDGWPLAPLFERWTSAVPLEAHEDEPERWRTWLPHGRDEADRAIDHAFVSRGVEVDHAAVLTGITELSDHLPLRIEVTV